ncbi:class I SAM-dependent methyltransferase [Agromyces bauzanensis]|uniref:Methyltransferase type 11 n=1 Tax=Agromyces bauzanensis TaxID=1308924 RepID=A0A917UTZ7_9MICO|nr:class I SAM-dependent methyltransferase [Agromyces bauzanensis]GGJ84970.1 methyltransferase type 11 [Agromyces bauzanensis]
MSAGTRIDRAGRDGAVFGAGHAEPYERILAGARTSRLVLQSVDGTHRPHSLEVGRWVRAATSADLTALEGATGPTLDVGCGPGRMVRAAAARSIPALGIDVAPRAVARARFDGSLALVRSVFHRLPLEGRWQTILLMDGNVGIGGDPEALLARCRDLLAPLGSIVIEVDADPHLEVRSWCTVVDDDGNESEPFPWARVGRVAIEAVAGRAGLAVAARWSAAGRHFVRAVPSP